MSYLWIDYELDMTYIWVILMSISSLFRPAYGLRPVIRVFRITASDGKNYKIFWVVENCRSKQLSGISG